MSSDAISQRIKNQVNPTVETSSKWESGTIRRKCVLNFLQLQTRSAMTCNVVTVSRGMSVRELEHLFETYDFNGFPIVEDHHLIGLVTKFDFLKNFIFTPNSVYPHYDELMRRTVEPIMTREVSSVHPTTPLTRVLQMMVEMRTKSFPVVDDKNRLLGMISRGDIIRMLKP